MKKRHVWFFRSVPPVRLYLEDIAEIADQLQELSPEAEITFTTPAHELVSLEELSGLRPREVSELEIRCCVGPKRFHDLLVSIGPEAVSLHRTGDTSAHRRTMTQIETLLMARRRGWQWREWLLRSASIIGPLSAVVLMLPRSNRLLWLFYVGVVLLGTSLSLIAVYLATKRWSTSQVVLVSRQERRVHWEDVAVAFFTIALVTAMALLTLLLAFLSRVLVQPVT
jgi:hypothetical protein